VISRVLVTGASRGIGRAVAEKLIAEGRALVLAVRERSSVADLRAEAIEVDLFEAEHVVDRAREALGGLDGVIHAAGIATHASIDAIDERDLDRAFALHVRAPLRLTRDLAAYLRAEERGGSIVHVASTLALAPAAGTAVYSATKAALVSFVRTAALDLAKDGIRVNAVAPGIVDTEMIRGRDVDALRALHPLGRLGTPREIADAIVFALDAEWMTGSVLTIDGGLTAGQR
jgi:3-oxoacyl-[acyl-carrier protein] reductase